MPPFPSRSPDEAATELRTLADRWRGTTLGEKQAFQLWFLDLSDALATNFIDCWKDKHVAVEAKATGAPDGAESVP